MSRANDRLHLRALNVSARGQVTFERLINAAKEPQNWLTYSGDYAGRRFSPLDQINTPNVHSLVAKWVYQTAATGKFETTPLVVDGMTTALSLSTLALDARSGSTSVNSRATSGHVAGA
jgi:glucose dehydrogenase